MHMQHGQLDQIRRRTLYYRIDGGPFGHIAIASPYILDAGYGTPAAENRVGITGAVTFFECLFDKLFDTWITGEIIVDEFRGLFLWNVQRSRQTK